MGEERLPKKAILLTAAEYIILFKPVYSKL